MRKIEAIIILLSVFLSGTPVYSQVFMDADNTGDAYARIPSKGYGYEVPDCIHPIRHITEELDVDLRKYIFVFYIHKSIDNDRCINFDRQRTEIKTSDSSPDSMKAFFGETLTSRWKFKLDAAFQPSSNFTHIHQIKAGDGTYDTDNPIITITPHKLSTNQLEIRFITPIDQATGGGATVKLTSVNLAPFLGVWVEAYESAKYDSNSHGTYSLQLKRLRDDSLLLSYSNSSLTMWRTGITFCRPKYGIYRSLLDSNSLRDEAVRFADFYLKKGVTFDLPSAPSGLNASLVSGSQVNVAWTDNSNNEGQFRIDRSTDGTTWAYLATAPANSTSYSDTGLVTSMPYYYRLRAENTYGNSAYSSTVHSLPVELISISAVANGLTAKIRWTTATETNNFGFEIERRSIASNPNWQKVGFVAGNGTSNNPHKYSFEDEGRASGRYAYRLKQIDNGGAFKYSSETEVIVGIAPKILKLEANYPNPFNPTTSIDFTIAKDGKAALRVYNVLGEEVAVLFNGDALAGQIYHATFDAGRLSSGLYFARLESAGQMKVQKLVLTK